jgi:ankyrin repeat protein
MSQDQTPAKPLLVTPAAGERGMTALHYAAYCNEPDAVLDQLRSGGSVDVRDENGWTPLHWSVGHGSGVG